jgi:hypothetical protein
MPPLYAFRLKSNLYFGRYTKIFNDRIEGFMRLIFLLTVFALFVCPRLGQKAKSNKSISSNRQASIKIDKKQPSIYITFEKFGKRTPLRDNESGDGIYLRFHNNLRYSIRFCAFGISDEAEQLIAYSKDTQMGLNYDVILNPLGIAQQRPKIDVPLGYPTGSTCFYYELKGGKTMVFAVPKEHLIEGVSIKIGFSYEWEEEWEKRPTHFVYFNSLDIPK